MRFGLVTYLWGKDMDLPTLIDVCEKSGLGGVETRTQHKHGVEPSLSKSARREVKKRFADSPVTLVGYGSNAQYHEADPAKVAANIELTKQYIHLMHDCGASGVKVKPNGFPRDVSREKTIEQIGKSLKFVGQQSIQLHGGIGMTMEAKIGHYFKRLTMIENTFGDTDYHQRRVADAGGLI